MRRQGERHREGWLALSALVSAGLALPVPPSAWHGPEVAATLAVAAIALLAGQRWAVAVIVLAEFFLLPTVWPRALLGVGGNSRLIALATLAAIVPGVLAMPRAAVALAAMTGRDETEHMCRYTQVGLLAIGVFAVLAPLL